MTRRIGVCSWSLQPSGPVDLARKTRACGLDWVQLALDPLRTGAWRVDETRHALHGAGIGILSGMMAMAGEDYATIESIRRSGGIRPDATWDANLAAARENAALARDLGLGLVTFHAGFLPDKADDPEREKLLDRIRVLVDVFAEAGVKIGLETGQESEGCLHKALLDLRRPGAGLNFDPANLILYGMGEPIEALDLLHEWVRQVHVKDAVASRTPGAWGEEVVAGAGSVDWKALFGVLAMRGVECDFVIEREAGSTRVEDVRRARILVEEHLGRTA
jgi:sugar phosphate isomerase/epimerase